MSNTLFSCHGLKKHFPVKGGVFMREVGRVYAVDGVDLEIKKGQTLGLVGESGCGKSTLGRTVLKLFPLTEGILKFEGQDITNLNANQMRPLRKDMQMIFQDPFAALNPKFTIEKILSEPLLIHFPKLNKNERRQRIEEILDKVGLRRNVINRYPHEFSGGQRQRIVIARALILEPKLIVADEPVSALDVSIQSQILNLMNELKEEFNLTFLFIAHNLSVIEYFSDEIAVMYLGKIVEQAKKEDLYKDPKHPYTQALISAVPIPDPTRKSDRIILQGDVPSPINPPSGCHFHPRCPLADDHCRTVAPTLKNYGSKLNSHNVSCHKAT